MSTQDEQGRLFRTLVLMGSSLALGCGGAAEQTADGAGGTAGTVNTGGSTAVGGATSTGGTTSSGGAPPTGGVTSVGGTWSGGATSVGGTAGSPATYVRPPEFDCPYEQVNVVCSGTFDEYSLPSWASCNYEAPVSAADCAAGERFVCHEATSTDDGGRFRTTIIAGCYCTLAEFDCETLCGSEPTSTCRETASPNAPAGTLDSMLCSGCFVAPILK